VQVTFGRRCPEGFLPVFSVDTEAEARALLVATCPRGPDGEFYSRELAHDRTLETLELFSQKLAAVYDRMREAQSLRAGKPSKKKCKRGNRIPSARDTRGRA